MAEIKWNNIDGGNMNTALGHLVQTNNIMYDRVKDLNQVFQNHLDNLQKGVVDQYNFETERNTQEVLNQLAGTYSQEDINRLRALGLDNAQSLQSKYGNRIDLSKVNQAKASWANDTLNRAESQDKIKDLTDASKQRRAEILALAEQGQTDKAISLLKQSEGLFSNKTFGDLNTHITSRFDADRKHLLDIAQVNVQERNAESNAIHAKVAQDNLKLNEAKYNAERLDKAEGKVDSVSESILKGTNQININNGKVNDLGRQLVNTATNSLSRLKIDKLDEAQQKDINALNEALKSQDFGEVIARMGKLGVSAQEIAAVKNYVEEIRKINDDSTLLRNYNNFQLARLSDAEQARIINSGILPKDVIEAMSVQRGLGSGSSGLAKDFNLNVGSSVNGINHKGNFERTNNANTNTPTQVSPSAVGSIEIGAGIELPMGTTGTGGITQQKVDTNVAKYARELGEPKYPEGLSPTSIQGQEKSNLIKIRDELLGKDSAIPTEVAEGYVKRYADLSDALSKGQITDAQYSQMFNQLRTEINAAEEAASKQNLTPEQQFNKLKEESSKLIPKNPDIFNAEGDINAKRSQDSAIEALIGDELTQQKYVNNLITQMGSPNLTTQMQATAELSKFKTLQRFLASSGHKMSDKKAIETYLQQTLAELQKTAETIVNSHYLSSKGLNIQLQGNSNVGTATLNVLKGDRINPETGASIDYTLPAEFTSSGKAIKLNSGTKLADFFIQHLDKNKVTDDSWLESNSNDIIQMAKQIDSITDDGVRNLKKAVFLEALKTILPPIARKSKDGDTGYTDASENAQDQFNRDFKDLKVAIKQINIPTAMAIQDKYKEDIKKAEATGSTQYLVAQLETGKYNNKNPADVLQSISKDVGNAFNLYYSDVNSAVTDGKVKSASDQAQQKLKLLSEKDPFKDMPDPRALGGLRNGRASQKYAEEMREWINTPKGKRAMDEALRQETSLLESINKLQSEVDRGINIEENKGIIKNLKSNLESLQAKIKFYRGN